MNRVYKPTYSWGGTPLHIPAVKTPPSPRGGAGPPRPRGFHPLDSRGDPRRSANPTPGIGKSQPV